MASNYFVFTRWRITFYLCKQVLSMCANCTMHLNMYTGSKGFMCIWWTAFFLNKSHDIPCCGCWLDQQTNNIYIYLASYLAQCSKERPLPIRFNVIFNSTLKSRSVKSNGRFCVFRLVEYIHDDDDVVDDEHSECEIACYSINKASSCFAFFVTITCTSLQYYVHPISILTNARRSDQTHWAQ